MDGPNLLFIPRSINQFNKFALFCSIKHSHGIYKSIQKITFTTALFICQSWG